MKLSISDSAPWTSPLAPRPSLTHALPHSLTLPHSPFTPPHLTTSPPPHALPSTPRDWRQGGRSVPEPQVTCRALATRHAGTDCTYW
eukprot:699166-Rhodomonas_salina.3